MSSPGQWHASAMQEAMNQALWKIDEHVLEAPRACSYAVAELVGDKSWGSSLFDQAPLIRVYLDSVWRIGALGVIDPGQEMKSLLEGCVAKAKQNEHRAFVHAVKEVNPVEFLAGLLQQAVGVYLEAYEFSYGSSEEMAVRQTQGHVHAGQPT